MAGKYGPSSVTLTLEDSPGGTARALTNFILEGVSAKTSAELMNTTALGDSFTEQTPTGLKTVESMTITCIWDTSTNSTHSVLGTVDDGPQDDGRELVVVFGDSKTFTVDVRLMSSEVVASMGSIQTIVAELVPTGAGVWS
jgi:hypothetical protein